MNTVILKAKEINQNVKRKRNLDNKDFKKHFGKGSFDIWAKDINTGESILIGHL